MTLKKSKSPTHAEVLVAIDILRDAGAKIVTTPKNIFVALKVK